MAGQAGPQRSVHAGDRRVLAPATATPGRTSTPSAPVTAPPQPTTTDEVQRIQSLAGNTAVQTVLPKTGTAKADPMKGVTSTPGKAGSMRLTLDGVRHDVGIDTFSFGGAVARDREGQAEGKPRLDKITVSRNSDDLSPLLMHALSRNANVGALEIDVVEAPVAGQPRDTFSYAFTSSRIAAMSTAGGAGPGTETLGFAFAGYSMTGPPKTKEQQDGQAAGGPGAAGEMEVAGLGGSKSSFGLANVTWKLESPTDVGTGQATGRTKIHHVIVTKELDAHSPLLLHAMMQNADLSSARVKLSGSAAGAAGPAASASELDLTHVQVDSVQQVGGAQPMETVAFSFAEFDLGSADHKAKPDADAPAQLLVKSRKSGEWAAPVVSWEWGATSPHDVATGQASGKRQLHEFKLAVPSGPPTVRFLEALQRNEDLTEVRLTPKSGPGYALASARVAGLDLAAGGDAKTTTVRMTYRVINQAAGNTEYLDSWDQDDPGGQAAAKGDAGTPGPGVAGRMRITFGKDDCVLPIESFSLGTTVNRSRVGGMATGAAQTSMAELTRHADGRSPLFFKALSTNQSFKNVTVEVVQPATQTEPAHTYTYTFGSARVAKLTQSGGAGGSIEKLSLAFGSMSMEAPPLGKDEKETSGGVEPTDAGRMQLVGIGIGGSGSADFGVSTAEWGAASPRDAASGQATGKAQMRQVTITKDLDRLSPLLQHALVTNAEISSGSLDLAGANTKLAGVRVDSIQQTSTGRPTEKVSFSFEGHEVESEQLKAIDAPAKVVVELEKQGKHEAPVLRWDWGAHAPTDTGTGQASGRRQHRPFTIAVPMGPASVRLLGALQSNERVKSAALTPKSGVAYVLRDASVVDLLSSAGGGVNETVVKFVYRVVEATSGDKSYVDSMEDNR